MSNPMGNTSVMPIGGAGILYPPHSLHPDVFDQDLYMRLCPLADDIWFWWMAKRNRTRHSTVKSNTPFGYPFDGLYQFIHHGSALTHFNRKKNMNDVQLINLLQHFNLTASQFLAL